MNSAPTNAEKRAATEELASICESLLSDGMNPDAAYDEWATRDSYDLLSTAEADAVVGPFHDLYWKDR